MYSVSKFANILFTLELSKRLKGTGITANSLHPGVIRTGIWRNIPFPLSLLFAPVKMCFKTVEEGARTTIFVATEPKLANVTGRFFCDCAEIPLNNRVQDQTKREKFWEGSIKIANLQPEEQKI